MPLIMPGDSSPIIQTHQLTKSFVGADGREFHALGPVDMSVARGEFVCIVGPSGCGKSTLLRIVAGLDSPTAGNLEILADDSNNRPVNSMVFQGDSTFPWMTVRENVEYGLKMRGAPYRTREQIVARTLQVVGLARFSESYPYQLSGGMRQRVALARAFANDPQLLLMDEPFGALDAQNRILLQDELLQIWEENNDAGARKTILFVTHSIDEAIVLADRVLVMTSVPGQIKTSIAIPFARPRQTYELKREPLFGELTYTIWEALRDEVNAARAAEMR
jgi:NitT/TauT family transport system ATP-binding protein